MTHRKYKNPPIEEALCEIRFSGSPEWDLSTPAKLQAALQATFPGKPRNQTVMEANFQLQGVQAGPLFQLKPVAPRLQLPDLEEHRLAAVAPNLLSIHLRRPYRGWEEEFQPLIEETFRTYVAVTSPSGIIRIGVRYINRIVIPHESLQLEDYFLGLPQLPEHLPHRFGAMMSRLETYYDDKPAKLTLTFASLQAPAGQVAFLLDLDLAIERDLPLDQAMEQIQDLRGRERVAFESLITDRTREVFDALSGSSVS